MADGSQTKELVTMQPRVGEMTMLPPTPVFDPGSFEHMTRIAKLMAYAQMVPDHLRGNDERVAIANCFMVVNQARNWGMDPFALAQGTFVTRGKIGYEGKVVAAALAMKLGLELDFDYFGEEGTDGRGIEVWDPANRKKSVKGTVGNWKTYTKDGAVNAMWTSQPDDQLLYRATRQWGRRYAPGVMLGVYSDDEIEGIAYSRAADRARDVTPSKEPARQASPGPAAPAPPQAASRTQPAAATKRPPSPSAAAAKPATEPKPEISSGEERKDPSQSEQEASAQDAGQADAVGDNQAADQVEEGPGVDFDPAAFLADFRSGLDACDSEETVKELMNANADFIRAHLIKDMQSICRQSVDSALKRVRAKVGKTKAA